MTVTRGNASDLKRWVVKMTTKVAPEKAALLHRKVMIQVGDGIILDTPVGNPSLWASPPPPNYVGGRARGSWQSTIGFIPTNEPNRIDPSGTAASSELHSTAVQIDPGVVSYITSNLAYMPRLNDGWSTQAPAAFIETNIDRVAAQFK